MYRVEFYKKAEKALKKMPRDRASKVLKSIRDLASLEDPLSHRQVIVMQGDWAGFCRMRVGSYRVIFKVNAKNQTQVLFIYHIGSRGDVYGG